jgi:hypothetical protein
MAGSASEREIRDAVVDQLRKEYPSARIIHELNCGHGSNRIDVAAVTPDRIIAVEIKSQRDTLSRLADQTRAFKQCSHRVIVCAHEKFFEDFAYNNGLPGFRARPELTSKKCAGSDLWLYPKPDGQPTREYYDWRRERTGTSIFDAPDTRGVLKLLWTDELRSVAQWGRVAASARAPGYKLAYHLWQHLTGDEVVKATCALLRARPFAEADPPLKIEQSPIRAGLLASVQ